jgi:hypothetical protein
VSRGLGRWQRLLLHELYHNPRIAPSGRRYINATDYASTESELSAVYRAARSLRDKGLVYKDASCQLDPLPESPVTANCLSYQQVSVQKTQDSGFSEHLGGVR